MFGYFHQETNQQYFHSNNLHQQNPIHNGHTPPVLRRRDANKPLWSTNHVYYQFSGNQNPIVSEPLHPTKPVNPAVYLPVSSTIFCPPKFSASTPKMHSTFSASGAPTPSPPPSRQESQPSPSNDLEQFILDKSKELSHAMFLGKRAVVQLSKIDNMDARQLTDVKSNLPEHIRTLNQLVRVISETNKLLFDNKISSTSAIYKYVKDKILLTETVVFDFQDRLNTTDYIINKEGISTITLNTVDIEGLLYEKFSGEISLNCPHIFEFLANLNSNFKISRTPAMLKAVKIKECITGNAKLVIPDDLKDFDRIVHLLVVRFGDPILILESIIDIHKEVGVIQSQLQENPPWVEIEKRAGKHLQLLRKAERINPESLSHVYENPYRNFLLLSFLPHEASIDLKSMQENKIDTKTLYYLIVQKFEMIFHSASKYQLIPKSEYSENDEDSENESYHLENDI